MIEASRTLALPSLSATLVRRRKPLLLAPPAQYVAMPVEATIEDAGPRWSSWRQDVRFFLGCYAAGLVFFFIMLS
jgi:hypothetical protein